jgi:dCMP deaminase
MSVYKSIFNLVKGMSSRPNWDEYFMSLALLTSSRSSCHRLKVGCVIVKDNYILSTGYNGFIAGGPHNSIVRDDHEQATIHAETNAIAFCAKRGINVNDAIAYITHFPCINCFKILVSSGIKTIKYGEDYKNDSVVYKLAEENEIKILKSQQF